MRQRIAQRLKDAQNTAAMLTTFQEVDMTNLIALRNNYKENFEKIHVNLLAFTSSPLNLFIGWLYCICIPLAGCQIGFHERICQCISFRTSGTTSGKRIHWRRNTRNRIQKLCRHFRYKRLKLYTRCPNVFIDNFLFTITFIVAVASPTGLVVPVLRNTEKMTFADIEKTIALFGNKAKNGTLALEEMTGKQLIRLQVYTDF